MEEKRKPKRWLTWLVVGLLVLIAYPLSYGPIISLERHGYFSASFMMNARIVYYCPVIWLKDNSPLGPLLDWYLELWYSL